MVRIQSGHLKLFGHASGGLYNDDEQEKTTAQGSGLVIQRGFIWPTGPRVRAILYQV